MPEKRDGLMTYEPTVKRFDEERYLRLQQEMADFYETERQGLLYAERNFVGTEPIIVVPVGDLHWGHFATDHRFIVAKLLRFIVDTPNAYGLGIGDNTESFLAHLVDTVVAQTAFGAQTQMDRFEEHFLERVYQKMLAQVADGYKGHDGSWPGKVGLNPMFSLGRRYGIPNLINGATLRLNFRESEDPESEIIRAVTMRVLHDPGHGSQVDPSRQGREAVVWADQLKIDAVVHGHVHDNYVAADPITTGDRRHPSHVVTFLSPGTPKGSGEGAVVDKFRAQVKGGDLYYDEPGATLVIAPQSSNGLVFYGGQSAEQTPTAAIADKKLNIIGTNTLREGQLIHQAVTALDRAESQGITQELVREIIKKFPKPTVVFDSALSVQSNEPHVETVVVKKKKQKKGEPEVKVSKAKKEAPAATQYRAAHYDIDTQLPIGFTFFANLRIGSEGSMPWRESLVDTVEDIADNPYRFAMLLRQLIDTDTATNHGRLKTLQEVIKIFKPLTAEHKILSLMLDKELRNHAWKRDIAEAAPAVRPGTLLASELDTILTSNGSDISLKVNGADPFHMITLDKLERYGTAAHPCQGLISMYLRRMRGVERPDLVVGGQFGAGTVSMYHRENPNTKWPKFIAPGYWAPIADRGKGNVADGPEGGQGVVIYPSKDEKLVFPMTNIDAGEHLYDALFLLKGLQLLGQYNRVVDKSRR